MRHHESDLSEKLKIIAKEASLEAKEHFSKI